MVNIRLAEIIENRLIEYKNGHFLFNVDTRFINGIAYGEDGNPIEIQDGTTIEIPREQIMKYLKNTLQNMEIVNNIDEIFTLNILDQKIFDIRNWKGTTETSIITAVGSLVKLHRMGLKLRTEEFPDSVVELIKQNRERYNSITFDGFLLNLLNEGLLNLRVMEESGFFKDLTPNRINELMNKRILNQKQLINLQIQGAISRECVIETIGGIENVVRLYKRAERNRNARDSKIFIELIGSKDAIILYSNGLLNLSDITKINVTKEQISILPEEIFVRVLERGLPSGIEFSSEELIEGYINKLSGKNLIELAEIGMVEKEKLIDLLDIEVDKENTNRKISIDDLKKTYTAEFIAEILMQKNINGEFIRKWKEKIFDTLDKEERDEYAKRVVELCKKQGNEKQFEMMMHTVIQNSILPIDFFKENSVRDSEIEEMYYNDEISEEEIINYYNSGLLGNESIQMLFGQDYEGMIEQIRIGRLSLKALSSITTEQLSNMVTEKAISLGDVFKVYAEFDKAIDVESLKYIVDEYEEDYYVRKELGEDVGEKERIVSFINTNTSMEMIRELYITNILSHSDILELQQKGLITEEQSKEISRIDRERLYKRILEGKVVGAEEDNKPERETTDNDEEKAKGQKSNSNRERTILEKKKFFRTLGKCDFIPIETNNPQEPFYGYTLIGYPEYGLIVLENLSSSKNNATYVMTIEEFRSYIDDKQGDKIVITKGKLALKDEIKRGQAIQERYHVRLWGKNVIDTMRRMSEEARERISYDTQIELSKMMVDEYDREEFEKLDPEDDRAKRIIAERDYIKSNIELEIRKRELRETKMERAKMKKKTRKEIQDHGET